MAVSSSQPSLLQPLTNWQLLDRTFYLYRRKFGVLLGLSALVQLPILLFTIIYNWFVFGALGEMFSNPAAFDPTRLNASPAFGSPLGSLLSILTGLVTQISSAALCWMAASLYLGQYSTLKESLTTLRTKLGRVIGVAFLNMGVAMCIMFFWVIVPCFGWITGLGLFMFYSLIVQPMLMPIILLENIPVFDSLRRAWELTRKQFWKSFTYGLGLNIVGQALIYGPLALLVTLIALFIADSATQNDITSAIQTAALGTGLATALVNIFFLPVHYIGAMLYYMDARVRHEGIDLAIQFGDAQADPLLFLRDAPRLVNEPTWFTRQEWGRFALICLAGIGIIVALWGSLVGLMFAIIGAVGGF